MSITAWLLSGRRVRKLDTVSCGSIFMASAAIFLGPIHLPDIDQSDREHPQGDAEPPILRQGLLRPGHGFLEFCSETQAMAMPVATNQARGMARAETLRSLQQPSAFCRIAIGGFHPSRHGQPDRRVRVDLQRAPKEFQRTRPILLQGPDGECRLPEHIGVVVSKLNRFGGQANCFFRACRLAA